MTTNPIFGRLITAMVTPFDAEGNIDYAVAEALATHLVEQGNDGLVICGTTGESPTLTHDEEFELFRVVKKAVGSKAKVIAGTGSNSTHAAIEATKEAAAIGVDGSLQVAPYYNKPPQEGLYQHFSAIASACPELPLMLYNIPGRTGINLTPETIAKLSEIENIVAIKEASGNLDHACKVRRLTDPNFIMYSGDDSFTLPLMTVGGVGVVSVAGHLVSSQIKEMILAFVNGKTEVAVGLNVKLFALFKALFCTTNPIPVKAALKLAGWQVGGCRSPLIELPENLKPQLETVLKEVGAIS